MLSGTEESPGIFRGSLLELRWTLMHYQKEKAHEKQWAFVLYWLSLDSTRL